MLLRNGTSEKTANLVGGIATSGKIDWSRVSEQGGGGGWSGDEGADRAGKCEYKVQTLTHRHARRRGPS